MYAHPAYWSGLTVVDGALFLSSLAFALMASTSSHFPSMPSPFAKQVLMV
jgi:hypothetical protein